MASYTTSLNLKKPAGSENVAIGDINNNMDIIDAAYGGLNISAYSTVSLASGVSGTLYLGKLGKHRILTGYFKPDNAGTNILVATLGSSDKPPVMIYGSCTGYNVGAQSEISIGTDGEIRVNVPSGGNNNTIKVNLSWYVN